MVVSGRQRLIGPVGQRDCGSPLVINFPNRTVENAPEPSSYGQTLDSVVG